MTAAIPRRWLAGPVLVAGQAAAIDAGQLIPEKTDVGEAASFPIPGPQS
jgi:hypothetical protein